LVQAGLAGWLAGKFQKKSLFLVLDAENNYRPAFWYGLHTEPAFGLSGIRL
jgi:hypothetical protein